MATHQCSPSPVPGNRYRFIPGSKLQKKLNGSPSTFVDPINPFSYMAVLQAYWRLERNEAKERRERIRATHPENVEWVPDHAERNQLRMQASETLKEELFADSTCKFHHLACQLGMHMRRADGRNPRNN